MKLVEYVPEGRLLNASLNNERVKSIDALERAMYEETILEGRCVLCDSSQNLHIEVGNFKGIIPRCECVYSDGNASIKDIAIISRVGKAVCFKIIGISIGENGAPEIILSRRKAQKDCIDNYIGKLVPGDIIQARVTHMEPFGCFVDVGCGVISLLSIDAMSVSRIAHPRDRFTAGQSIKVIVKSVDRCSGRVMLTHKELLGTWEENASMFSVGQTAAGIIRSIEPYGIFIELTPNLAGLSECKDGVAVGQHAAVYIKSIIKDKMKVKLVLVDSYPCENNTVGKYDYFYKEPHIDYWKYSPDGCSKIIESYFS